jgi:hypothetical protein
VVTDSTIYWGKVNHRRYAPKVHAFTYNVMMFCLFTDEIDVLADSLRGFALEGNVTGRDVASSWRNMIPGTFTLRRKDFLPEYPGSLDDAARAMYHDLVGTPAPGRIAVMANLSSLGWNFNPITLFFFFDHDHLERTILEVTNTPWGERHLYVLGGPGSTRFEKAHHVSPFLEMDGTYQLTYAQPDEHFRLSMALFDGQESEGPRRFSASMSLDRRSLTQRELLRAARSFPDMAFRVSFRIYLQAARLFAKGVKYVPHPPRRLKGADDVH